MSSSQSTQRKKRTTNHPSQTLDESTLINEFKSNLHSSNEFIQFYNQIFSTQTSSRSIIISSLCQILTIEHLNQQICFFILDCLLTNHEHINENQFKLYFLPFIKQTLVDSNDFDVATIRVLRTLIQHRASILQSTLAEWLSCLFNFLVKTLSPSNYTIYNDLIIDLFEKFMANFVPLSKDIIDILSRSSSITSSPFLQQLKVWIKNSDDIHLSLFAIHLWQSIASILNRLVIRGHSKGNEILAVIEDAFLVSNYSIRSAAFTSWSQFILTIHQLEEFESSQLNTRLLKLFLAPFLSDSTSKSKSASISKCHAWIKLISVYPTNVHDVILPFLSFAFGDHLSLNTISTTTAWWSECRQIGGEFLHDFLQNTTHGELIIKLAADQILNYLFDFIVEQLLTLKIQLTTTNMSWLNCWNVYLNHLMNIFKTTNAISNEQRVAINTCLLTRIEQLWIDSRIETCFLLKLFETFEQIGFPLAIETVLRDSSIRTKTLSAAQIHPSSASGNYKSQDLSLAFRTTLSDQYLHMMLEHAIRFNDEDLINEESYLHVLTYLIDTLAKTSDENFCSQTSSLLLKCSVEYSHQPLIIPTLFWHIWFRCSTHLISILNRSHTFELNNKIDNQKQETSIELLLRPFAFHDIQRLDYSYTLLWIQLYKTLCRLILINNDNLIDLLVEILRNEPAFEQAIINEQNQRLFGLILIILKTLLKTFSEIDCSNVNNQLFSTTSKRSSSIALCFTQFAVILNHILKRLINENENNTQYILVCNCLVKSTTKLSSNEQSQAFILNYIRDLIVDLLNTCKTYSQFEICFQNLTELISFLYFFEQTMNINSLTSASPISKQQIDNIILNKLLSIITLIFEPTNGLKLLQLISPILILAFQNQKTILRTKARKCWNETFGRMSFIVYPNELRICLRELKDKEHLLLPCFLADHDNSNTAGSGHHIPSSTDESQLSQQIDIPTPLISYQTKVSSPAKVSQPTNRSMTVEKHEPVFVPILQNSTGSPVAIGKRLSTTNSCLTEKQKEKLRTRNAMPLLCDDNTQSNSCTVDSSSNEQKILGKQKVSTNLSLFNQAVPPVQENPSNNDDDDADEENVPEETSISKKLRRSCRPSLSARKSLVKKSNNNVTIPIINELATTVPMETSTESTNKQPKAIKGILKRLSPNKPRQVHSRRVVFHDQVKVLVFASPSRRDLLAQMRKKSPNKDEFKSPTRIIPKENLPLRKQPMSARRLSVMNTNEHIIPSSPSTNKDKTRSSKLFHPNDVIADWTQTQVDRKRNMSMADCTRRYSTVE